MLMDVIGRPHLTKVVLITELMEKMAMVVDRVVLLKDTWALQFVQFLINELMYKL